MSSRVDRTCTELDADSSLGVIHSETQPLSAFRHTPAFVLLGDAGSGKTTEFKGESEALVGSAEFLSARDFTTLDVDSHPEWRHKTLFIDGLDEMRAGTSNSLRPLDQIRNRLDRLGRPNFRLSCREADWLGTNDRQDLASVSPDKQVTVLRLDPLDDDAITALLNSLDLHSGAKEFIDEARAKGVGAVLHNPHTLKLLADAVGQGGDWPKSRQETFEMACRKMASEQNEGHLLRTGRLQPEAIMDAAGYLCAVQLLVGIEGYSLTPVVDDPSFAAVDELLESPNKPPLKSLKRALTTRLFSGADERGVSPVHRHIAEFLAGRYLANLIGDGLPAGRVTALMTSPSDQRVVTVLRGLSAWLAAHSREARPLLIEADPIGVGLYGDIEGFSTDEKMHLLESLAAFAKQGPLFGHERTDGRGSWHIGSAAQAFRSLATAEMKAAIKDLLTGPVDDSRDYRVMEFVLEVVSEADEEELDSLAELSSDFEAILRDPAKPPHVKSSALDAFLQIAPPGEPKTQVLMRLLDEIHEGVLPDPDGQLRRTLLSSLYPSGLSPSEVWKFAMPLNPHNLNYRIDWFFSYDLLKTSSGQQIAELLDALHEDATNLIPALKASMLDKLAFQLLARGLEECGEDIEMPRLNDWLSIVCDSLYRLRWEVKQLRRIQEWLVAHPHIQQAIFLTWLRHSKQDDLYAFNLWGSCNVLLESEPPSDFGLWCLDKAIELADTESTVAQHLLTQSYRSRQRQTMNKGLSLGAMRARTRGHDALARRLEELCAPPTHSAEPSEHGQRWSALEAELKEKERQQQADWDARLRSQESELQENRLDPRNLHTLALVYFGRLTGAAENAPPDQRIREFIGGDPDLANAVMAALRAAIWRADVPEADETISLILDSKYSWLAEPVLASLDLLHSEDPTLLDELDDTLKRKALAIHYCVFSHLSFMPDRPSPWFDQWLKQDSALVADVLFQCAQAAMRAGEQFLPGLTELDSIEDAHADLAYELSTRLLSSFPARAPQAQISLLDQLLDKVLKADKPGLEALIKEKLAMKSMDVAQRTRWLTVGALLSPEQHLVALEEFAGKNEQRIRHLAGFLCNRFHNHWFANSPLFTNLDANAVAALIRLMGSIYSPMELHGVRVVPEPNELDVSRRTSDLISLLGSKASYEAHDALSELIENPQLSRWKDRLTWEQERQRVLLSDATYNHPSIEQVQRTLDNGLPANAADLAALLNEHLGEIADSIRGSNSNVWRQFWNEGPDRSPSAAKHEESCRDALLASLQQGLPRDIDAAPEGRYASDKRADIRVSYGGFNVPIEIKKNCHPHMWSALHNQLIKQYTTDSANSGHGIYLVLWFDPDKTTRSPDGHRPATPEELGCLLENELTPDQARKICVRVLDVTKP